MTRFFLSVILIGLIYCSGNAAHDEKFFKKAAEIVWSMELPEFNPTTQIPDTSLYNNESAIILAAYKNVDVKLREQRNITKYTSTGRAYTNAIDAKILTRVMIKLKDSKSVEEYSEFDIESKDKESILNYSYQYSNTAFGARIYKPSGEIVNIDCSEAYTITSGKGRKEKDEEHKIAIAGLESGDILEYFYYDEIWLDELDLDPIIFTFAQNYPIMTYKIECHIDPSLTIEYRNLNGAPLLFGGFKKDGTRTLEVTTINLAKRERGNWMAPARQIPYIKMRVLNNNSTMTYRPKSARRGGVFCSLPAENYYDDISYILHDVEPPTKIASRATKIAKKYIEKHPELTSRQIIDMAWLATLYSGLIDDDSHSNIALSIYFQDVLKKLKIKDNMGIGIVNSREDVPVTEILHWKEPDYMNVVGDSCYIFSGDYCFQPGEYIGGYQGEQAAVFWGDRKEFNQISATMIQLPTSRASQNMFRTDINASINSEDNNIIDIHRTISLKGSVKSIASKLIDSGKYIKRVEDFLEIEEKDRHELKKDSIKIKEKQQKLFRSEAESLLGIEPRNIHNYNISAIGATPDEPTVVYNMSCDVDGLVKRAGKDLVISLGKLFGNQTEVTGSNRNRQSAIVLDTPTQNRYVLNFTIPDDYTVNETSLSMINKNVVNECGAFYAQAKVNDNILTIQINERYLHYVIPVEKWDKFLEIIDTSAAFSNFAIVLNHK